MTGIGVYEGENPNTGERGSGACLRHPAGKGYGIALFRKRYKGRLVGALDCYIGINVEACAVDRRKIHNHLFVR